MFSELHKPPIIGRIGLIQERGMKLRAVANPFRIYQYLLSPLGDFIYDILKGLDYDCTFDQSKGVTFIEEALAKGKTLYAYDLSNATDRFPLSIQIDVIRNIVRDTKSLMTPSLRNKSGITLDDLDNSIDLLHDLSRGRWYSPKLSPFNKDDDYLMWKTGQPLGLYPSFGLFALTHGLLIRTIEEEFGVSGSFRVLGDDVIISDSRVALRYKEIINQVGCSISESKSLISKDFGEFAGKIVGSQGVIPVEKWKDFSVNNPFGPIDCLGIPGLQFVPKVYRKRMRFLSSLPHPFGRELNPDGIDLQSRVDLVWDRLYPKSATEINDYTVSYQDSFESVNNWWKNVVWNNDSKTSCSRLPYQRDVLPQMDDLPISFDRCKIEHYNTYVRSLKGYETCTITKPSVLDRFPNRNNPHSGSSNSTLFSLFKLIAKPKGKRSIKNPF